MAESSSLNIDIKPIDRLVTNADNGDGTPQFFNMDTSYANQNKWFAYFPLENVLGSKYKNLNLHLTRFTIPQLEQTSNEVSFRGYTKEVPTKVLNASTKQLTLDYIVDSNWFNYKALYAWMSGIYGTLNPIVDSHETIENISPSDYLPLRIYLLGPYKKKVIQFLFENTWIKSFNDVSMDVNQPDEVVHSFTIVFDKYTIESI